jgi:hypothetical protein
MRAFEQRKKNIPASGAFFEPKIQKKLKTGTAGDKYEVEADNVADKVVNNNASGGGLMQAKEQVQQKPVSETISFVQAKDMKEEEKPVQKKSDRKEEEKPVQKKEKEEEKPVQKKSDKEEEKPIQAKCVECEKEDKVQKKAKKEEEKPVQKKGLNSDTEIQNKELEGKLDNSKGGGTGLDKKTKREMESGFGADFSNVKIHTDTNAVQMSEELGAQAFTHGNDVYFNKGKYNPNSKEGKHLLAHELTHTIQQTGSKTPKNLRKKAMLQLATIPWNIRQWTTHKRISNNFSVGSRGSVSVTSNLVWVGPSRCNNIASTVEIKIYRSVDYWFDSKVHSDTISLVGGSTSVLNLDSGTYYVEIYLGGYNGDPTHCSLTGNISISAT